MTSKSALLCFLMTLGCAGTSLPETGEGSQVVGTKPRLESKGEKTNLRSLPVPYGTTLGCDDLLSKEGMASHLQGTLQFSSSSETADDLTAQCAVVAAVDSKAQELVPPGETLCEVDFKCSYFYEVAELEEQCVDEGGELGNYGEASVCTRHYRRGRTSFEAMDPETGCVVEVRSGLRVQAALAPSVTNACGLGALDSLGKDSLAPPEPDLLSAI